MAGALRKHTHFAIRSATAKDYARLDQPRARLPEIQKLRHTHHMIARLAAAGFNNIEIANRTGFTKERICQLLPVPAMVELIAQYRKRIDDQFDIYADLATRNMIIAERHIAERLEDLEETGERLGIREALAISRDAADRFGYGKKQTNLNVNIDFAAKLEGRLAKAKKFIDGTSSSVPAPAQVIPLVPQQRPPAQTKELGPEPLKLRRL